MVTIDDAISDLVSTLVASSLIIMNLLILSSLLLTGEYFLIAQFDMYFAHSEIIILIID